MSLVIVHISERVHCETYRPNTNRQFSRATIDRQLSTKDDSSDRFLLSGSGSVLGTPYSLYSSLLFFHRGASPSQQRRYKLYTMSDMIIPNSTASFNLCV